MIDDRMAVLEAEFDTLEADLADPVILADSDRVRDLSRRHKELGEIVRAWHELSNSRADLIVVIVLAVAAAWYFAGLRGRLARGEAGVEQLRA